MQPIKDLLNKIKWDKKENPEDYTIVYEDRIQKSYIEIPYIEIIRIEGTFMVLERDGDEVNIPLHRIHGVKKKGIIIWKR